MFNKHIEISQKLVLLVLGTMTIAVIIIFSWLFFLLISRFYNENHGQISSESAPAEQKVDVVGEYNKTMRNLQKTVLSSNLEKQNLLEQACGVFLSVKVPQEMLDEHLSAFLACEKLKHENSETENFKEEVLLILDGLMKKLE
jgi:hypothetical protein